MMNNEILDYGKLTELIRYGNLFENGVLEEIESMTKKQILKNHKYEIYFSEKEQAWRTYLPDINSKNKRRQLKRKDKSHLENEIVKFYLAKAKEDDLSSKSLEYWYKAWMIYKRDYTSAKSKTIQEYSYEWKLFYEGTELASTAIRDIKPITLIRFFRKVTKDRLYTYKRISNARCVLNGIMSYAIEEEAIEHNPVSDVNFKQFTYKPVEVQYDNVFTKTDTQILLNYLKDIEEPYALAIQLSFYLFIRVGETKALRWQDCNFESRTIYLHRQVTTERRLNDDMSFSKREVMVSDTMKGYTSQGYRTQYLTDEAIVILNKAKRLFPDSVYIFEPNGLPMTTDRFNRKLKKYCNEAGITYHSSHKIRFYNASTAYDGKNLVTISKMMGHSQVQTTMHYLRNVQSDETQYQVFSNLGLQQT